MTNTQLEEWMKCECSQINKCYGLTSRQVQSVCTVDMYMYTYSICTCACTCTCGRICTCMYMYNAHLFQHSTQKRCKHGIWTIWFGVKSQKQISHWGSDQGKKQGRQEGSEGWTDKQTGREGWRERRKRERNR